jgi:sodium transport system ATP-binding protein
VPRRPGKSAHLADPGQSSRQQGTRFHAVRDVSFQVHGGTIVGLLGPNGAGKTTLLRMLSTAIRPSTGTARFDGVDIVAAPLEVRKKLGFLSGTTGIYGRLTAREMVAYYGALHGLSPAALEPRMRELFALLDMESYADRRNDQLSTGMKQKVSIARTLIHDPAIVIFDEPTTGLDVAAAEVVTRIIARCKQQGKTVLFSTHHMHEVELLCDHVVMLREGRQCFDGTVSEMRARTGEDKLDRAFLALMDGGE